jgi:hypothetical protein
MFRSLAHLLCLIDAELVSTHLNVVEGRGCTKTLFLGGYLISTMIFFPQFKGRVPTRYHKRTSLYAYVGKQWILAIIAVAETGLAPFLAPDLVSCSLRVLLEFLIPFSEVSVNSRLTFLYRLVVAGVYDCPTHAAVDRLDDVQELSGSR